MYQRSRSFFDLCPRPFRTKQDLRCLNEIVCCFNLFSDFLVLSSFLINKGKKMFLQELCM